jgi:hypothetical protein
MNDINKFEQFEPRGQFDLLGKFVNLTPHDISVVSPVQSVKTYVKSGTIARVSQESAVAFTVDDVEISDVVYGEVIGLPDQSDGVYLIVSGMIKDAVKKSGSVRTDIVSPGDLVRNSDGVVIGCKGFFR